MYLYLVGLLLHARAQHALLLLVAYTAVGSGCMLLAFLLQYTLHGVAMAIPLAGSTQTPPYPRIPSGIPPTALMALPIYPLAYKRGGHEAMALHHHTPSYGLIGASRGCTHCLIRGDTGDQDPLEGGLRTL